MSIVAFIPARGGSKGVPGKNYRLIAGKPLIAWSIEHALRSELIDEVYVSTDCQKVAEVAVNWGARVPFIRPESISGDTATTESAMLHFCEYALNTNLNISDIVLLQCTSPIRPEGGLDSAIKMYLDEGFDSLVSVAETHRFFWHDLKNPKASYDYFNRPRRQDIAESDRMYVETGSFYISSFKKFIENKNRLFGAVGLFVTGEDEAYEIDSLNDFLICETLLKKNIENMA